MAPEEIEIGKENNSEANGNVTSIPDFATKEKQEARAFLRERFLQAMSRVTGSDVEIKMFENTNVTANFGGSDLDCMHLYVKDLKTPMGTIPEGVLRVNDIISIHFPDINAKTS